MSKKPKGPPEEVVLEKHFAGYRLDDGAIDLEKWLRDGLEVYNLFVYMKPLFFQMLLAHGGTFTGSARWAAEERGKYRLRLKANRVGTLGEADYDEPLTATLELAPDVTPVFEHPPLPPIEEVIAAAKAKAGIK